MRDNATIANEIKARATAEGFAPEHDRAKPSWNEE